MAYKISLSSIWRKGQSDSLRDFFSTGMDCGFQHFVLDGSVALTEITNISLPEGQIPAITLPCPAHPRNAEAQFSSLDRYEKEAAREAAKNSFELAYDLRADVLLVNLGRVDIDARMEQALWDVAQAEGLESENFQSLRHDLIDIRARNASPHLKSALFDVEYLANLALEYGVKLAITTPTRYSGYPLPEELQIILEEFGDPVFYWHDVGYAEMFASLDLLPSAIWLDMFSAYIIGAHIHDVKGFTTGLPPQEDGQVDFLPLKQALSDDSILSCQLRNISSSDLSAALNSFIDLFQTQPLD